MKSTVRIAVTGAAGYAGSYIRQELLAEFKYVESIDILNGQDFNDINPNKYDVVIHFAAISDNSSCELNSVGAVENNILKLYDLLEKLDKSTLFIFASTAAVYGSSQHENLEQEMLHSGISTYTQTKIVGERFCVSNIAKGKNIVILRLGTLFGVSPNMQHRTVVNGMTKTAFTTGEISCVNKMNKRALLSLKDLLTAVRKIINNPIPGIYNLCSDNMSMEDVALLIQRKIKCRIKFSETVDQFSSFSFQISNSKFREIYGEFRDHPIDLACEEIVGDLKNG